MNVNSVSGSQNSHNIPLVVSVDKESSLAPEKISVITTIFNHIKAFFIEFASFIAMSALYFFNQTRLDPKEGDIEKNEDGVATQPPIILVHGYLHNSSGWKCHRRQLNKAGFKNVFTVNLGAIPNKSIDDYAHVLHKRVEEVTKLTGRQDIKLIGHSMGGLVSSHYALRISEEKNVKVTDIITLASPLKGTKMHVLGFGPCVKEMAHGCDFIKSLSEDVKKCTETRFFHVASRADLVVHPYYSTLNMSEKADLDSRNRNTTHIAQEHGHTSLLFSKRVVNEEIRFLNLG